MYIDPSAGSLVLQIIAAGFITAMATISRLREGLKRFVTSHFRRRTER